MIGATTKRDVVNVVTFFGIVAFGWYLNDGVTYTHKLYREALACEQVDCAAIVAMSKSPALAPTLKKGQ